MYLSPVTSTNVKPGLISCTEIGTLCQFKFCASKYLIIDCLQNSYQRLMQKKANYISLKKSLKILPRVMSPFTYSSFTLDQSLRLSDHKLYYCHKCMLLFLSSILSLSISDIKQMLVSACTFIAHHHFTL